MKGIRMFLILFVYFLYGLHFLSKMEEKRMDKSHLMQYKVKVGNVNCQ